MTSGRDDAVFVDGRWVWPEIVGRGRMVTMAYETNDERLSKLGNRLSWSENLRQERETVMRAMATLMRYAGNLHQRLIVADDIRDIASDFNARLREAEKMESDRDAPTTQGACQPHCQSPSFPEPQPGISEELLPPIETVSNPLDRLLDEGREWHMKMGTDNAARKPPPVVSKETLPYWKPEVREGLTKACGAPELQDERKCRQEPPFPPSDYRDFSDDF